MNLPRATVFARLHTLISSSSESPLEFLQQALALLRPLGFSRIRFWEIEPEGSGRPAHAVLLASAPSSAQSGYSTPLTTSSLARDRTAREMLEPRVESIDSYQGSKPKWVTDLDLTDKYWVDIPVLASGHLVAIIAADWPRSGRPDIPPAALKALALFGVLVGDTLVRHIRRVADGLVTPINAPTSEKQSVEALLAAVCESLVRDLPAQSVSVFEYEWAADELVKSAEALGRPTRDREPTRIRERYQIGESFTGRAWQSDDHCFVPDVHARLASDAGPVPPALVWHESNFGTIRSIMYRRLGNDEPRLLLRLVVSATSDRAPHSFLSAVLDRVSGALSRRIDDLLQQSRLQDLQRLCQEALRLIGEPNRTIDLVSDLIKREGIRSFAILAHALESSRLSQERLVGPVFSNRPKAARRSWADDHLYLESTKGEDVRVLRVRSDAESNSLGTWLKSRDVRRVAAIPFTTESTRGALLIPFTTKSHQRIAEIRRERKATLNLFRAYASIVGQSVEAAASNLSADAAAALVGHIGHELSAPLAALGNAAIGATSIAKIVLGRLPFDSSVSERTRVAQIFDVINDRKADVTATLEVAVVIGQSRGGAIRLNLRPLSLLEVVTSVVETLGDSRQGKTDLEHYTTVVDLNGHLKRYVFKLTQSFRKLDRSVCDSHLISMVFANVLRNAMKYSLEPPGDDPMVIAIRAQPQIGMSIVEIENWGVGVAVDELDSIFLPFVRGRPLAGGQITKGMGVGLYVCRRIMNAHRGSILCTGSDLDVRRGARTEDGYVTTFQIRIPSTLRPGRASHMRDVLTYDHAS